MKYRKLGLTDMNVSEISLGGASFSNIYGPFDEERGIKLVKESLACGINYIETGPWYGQGSSERTIGKALQGVPRNSYYIASKVGRYEKSPDRMFDFSAERTYAGVENTLKLLGVEYVDLIQVHDLSFAPDISIVLNETLPALERAVKSGKVRYIGLADYDIELMIEVIEKSNVKISTILSYAKSTMFDNRLQNYTKYFKEKKIGIINAAATGMGLLTNKGPQPWHPASDDIKVICKQASEYCQSVGVELATLATFYTLSQPHIDTHVCGFYDVSELHSTIAIVHNQISAFEKQVLEELKSRFFDTEPLHWDNVEVEAYKASREVAI